MIIVIIFYDVGHELRLRAVLFSQRGGISGAFAMSNRDRLVKRNTCRLNKDVSYKRAMATEGASSNLARTTKNNTHLSAKSTHLPKFLKTLKSPH